MGMHRSVVFLFLSVRKSNQTSCGAVNSNLCLTSEPNGGMCKAVTSMHVENQAHRSCGLKSGDLVGLRLIALRWIFPGDLRHVG
jgi:hypothetical protein